MTPPHPKRLPNEYVSKEFDVDKELIESGAFWTKEEIRAACEYAMQAFFNPDEDRSYNSIMMDAFAPVFAAQTDTHKRLSGDAFDGKEGKE